MKKDIFPYPLDGGTKNRCCQTGNTQRLQPTRLINISTATIQTSAWCWAKGSLTSTWTIPLPYNWPRTFYPNPERFSAVPANNARTIYINPAIKKQNSSNTNNKPFLNFAGKGRRRLFRPARTPAVKTFGGKSMMNGQRFLLMPLLPQQPSWH